jgi:hypothetical protein
VTDEEIKKLATEIVKQRGGFYVDPEDHYKQHQRLDRMLDLYDSASSIVFKGILGLVVGGLIFLAAVGMGMTK